MSKEQSISPQSTLPRLDPVRVSEFTIASAPEEVLLVLRRVIFMDGGENNLHPVMTPTVAAALSWSLVRQIRDQLDLALAERDAPKMDIAERMRAN